MNDERGPEINMVLHVWDESLQQCLSVRQWPDASDVVELYTDPKCGTEFYGEVAVTMSPEHARAVSRALLMIADACEAQRGSK